MMKRLMTVALSAVIAVSAFAQTFSESEPNNTRATADTALYGLAAPWARVGVLTLTPNDTDFFKISLNAGDYLTAITFPTATNYVAPDTVMALFDTTGTTAIVFNDDAGSGFGSAIRWQADQTGDYFLAITGFHGGGQSALSYYEGASHTETGAYILTVSVVPVPEPASMMALGTGLVSLMALRRRKRA
ncbi:MAG: PEP-CTERM sorting domain-containing protein [Fimbriimonadales bacterium]